MGYSNSLASFLVTLGISATSAFAGDVRFDSPAGWKRELQRELAGVVIWGAEDATQSTVTLLEKRGAKSKDLPADDSRLIESIRTGNSIFHLFSGIRDWKVRHVERVKSADGTLVKLAGSYLDSTKKRVQFEEWKFYYDRGFAQATYTEVSREPARSREEIATILGKFRPLP